jgi:hypothetical protein
MKQQPVSHLPVKVDGKTYSIPLYRARRPRLAVRLAARLHMLRP